jgi:Zn-dependent protease
MDFAIGIDIPRIIMFVAALLLSMSVHEAMHGLVAHRLGDDTAEREGRLTFNPLAHIDPFLTVILPTLLVIVGLPPILAAKPVPFNPYRLKYEEFGVALVGIAGPLTNLALAAAAAPLLSVFATGSLGSEFLLLFIKLNVGLFVFNMLPIPPLDGSRVIYAFAPDFLRKIMEQIESMGLFFLIALILLFGSFINPIIQAVYVPIVNFLI